MFSLVLPGIVAVSGESIDYVRLDQDCKHDTSPNNSPRSDDSPSPNNSPRSDDSPNSPSSDNYPSPNNSPMSDDSPNSPSSDNYPSPNNSPRSDDSPNSPSSDNYPSFGSPDNSPSSPTHASLRSFGTPASPRSPVSENDSPSDRECTKKGYVLKGKKRTGKYGTLYRLEGEANNRIKQYLGKKKNGDDACVKVTYTSVGDDDDIPTLRGILEINDSDGCLESPVKGTSRSGTSSATMAQLSFVVFLILILIQ